MAVSSDLRWLAVGSWDGTLTLWALPEFKPVLTQKTGHGLVFGVAFSPDSRFLATGGADQLIKLWEVPNSASELLELPLSGTLKGHRGQVFDLAFSPRTELSSSPRARTKRRGSGQSPNKDAIGWPSIWMAVTITLLYLCCLPATEWSGHGDPAGWCKAGTFEPAWLRRCLRARWSRRTHGVPDEGIRYLAGDGLVYGCATDGEMTAWDLFTGQSRLLLPHPPSPYIAGVVTNQGQQFVLVRNMATSQTEAWLAGSSQPCTEPWTRVSRRLQYLPVHSVAGRKTGRERQCRFFSDGDHTRRPAVCLEVNRTQKQPFLGGLFLRLAMASVCRLGFNEFQRQLAGG
jgi:hypothetical protein